MGVVGGRWMLLVGGRCCWWVEGIVAGFGGCLLVGAVGVCWGNDFSCSCVFIF